MSIAFGHFSTASIEENPDLREAISRERGEVTRPVSRAEMNERLWRYKPSTGDFGAQELIPAEFVGRRIDLKPGAWTDEEIEGIRQGEVKHLSYEDYGTKWRLWEGWPTDEQMIAEPWEE